MRDLLLLAVLTVSLFLIALLACCALVKRHLPGLWTQVPTVREAARAERRQSMAAVGRSWTARRYVVLARPHTPADDDLDSRTSVEYEALCRQLEQLPLSEEAND